MEMVSVESSQISQIGHDSQSKLRVLFRRGGLYEYSGVTAEEFTALRAADSVGSHFAKFIKGAKPFTRVTEDPIEASKPPILPSADDLDAVSEEKAIAKATARINTSPEDQNQEVEKVAEQSSALVQNAITIKVIDPESQTKASEMLLAVAAMLEQIKITFEPMKQAAYRAHKVICDQETKLKSPLVEAEKALKGEIGAYALEQQRIADELDAANRKAERERAELEARQESQDQALTDAIQLEAQGDIQAAEAILASPAPTPIRYTAPAPIAPNVSRTSGIGIGFDWDFRITNEALIPREHMLPNESSLRSLGKTTHGKAVIPGVEFYKKPRVSTSRTAKRA